MKGHQWCDFEFDKDYFPDADGFISRLKGKGRKEGLKEGLKICVWVRPDAQQLVLQLI
jgi:alpha-D-xyloside xylohydrolase